MSAFAHDVTLFYLQDHVLSAPSPQVHTVQGEGCWKAGGSHCMWAPT